MATLVGSGFTVQGLHQAAVVPWPTQLAGLRVTFNGTDAPIVATTDTLIQLQCPVFTAGTPISLTVEAGSGQSTDALQFVMQEATPGLYKIDGANQGAVIIAGTNQIAMPATDSVPSRPAKRGEYLVIYANGLGPVQELLPAGTPAPVDHLIRTTDQVAVVIGDVELPPSSSSLAPGQVGLYQVNVQLTSDVPIGDSVSVYVKVVLGNGTVVKSNTVTVAVQDSDSQQ